LLIAALAAGLLAPALTATEAVAAEATPTNVKIS
jgi:hypothetical protein